MAVHYIEKAKCEQMREDSIRRILTAAMHLFADNGYTATTMQMIAREANLVPSGIYHYFSGKEGLLEEIINREVAAIDKTLNIGFRDHLLQEGLDGFLDYMADSVCEHRERIALLCQMVQLRCMPEYCRCKLQILRMIGEIIREHLPDSATQEALRKIMTDFTGIAVFYAVSGRRDIFIQQVEDLKSRRETLLFSRLPLPVTAEIPI